MASNRYRDVDFHNLYDLDFFQVLITRSMSYLRSTKVCTVIKDHLTRRIAPLGERKARNLGDDGARGTWVLVLVG
jgi:hypothetical protein